MFSFCLSYLNFGTPCCELIFADRNNNTAMQLSCSLNTICRKNVPNHKSEKSVGKDFEFVLTSRVDLFCLATGTSNRQEMKVTRGDS